MGLAGLGLSWQADQTKQSHLGKRTVQPTATLKNTSKVTEYKMLQSAHLIQVSHPY